MPTSNGENSVPSQGKRQRLSPPEQVSQWSTSIPENFIGLRPENHCGTCSAFDLAGTLIVEILKLIVGREETLELELKSLRQFITLTNLAMQTYECTPLGQNLINSIMPEVEQIHAILHLPQRFL
jgi:hypothetical protein